MVILIGGTAGVGKTLLARRIMERSGIPFLPVDHLMMGIYRSDPACGFTPESDVQRISDALWPILFGMIKTSIENGLGYTYEGFQILPGKLASIGSEYRAEIRSAFPCLGEEYIESRYETIRLRRNAVERRADLETKEEMLQRNREFIAACEASGIRPFVIRRDYEAELEVILEAIVGPALG
ncbi:MAG TPA: hypothetical protein VFL04_09300 [Rectinemataceae bacterium]|nr:hypothetical protein [Rectinemataceae bacterium]